MELIEIFSKKEQEYIKIQKIFTLRNNNFLDFIMFDDSDVPTFKYTHISKKLFKKTKTIIKSNNI